jgi:hypothetical protein
MDPSTDDDNENTGGNGFFDSGSRWLNTVTPSIWQCIAGPHAAAQWVKVYPTPPPGASTVVTGTSPIAVAFDGMFTYDVSLTSPLSLGYIPSLPASQITSGTFPAARIPSLDSIAGSSGPLTASNLGSGYPFSDLAGTATPSQLPTLTAIAAATGALAAAQVGSGYPFADLSGVPAFPASSSGNMTLMSTSAYQTAISIPNMNYPMQGSWSAFNTGANTVRCRGSTTSYINGADTTTFTINSGSIISIATVQASPYPSYPYHPADASGLLIEFEDFTAGQHSTVQFFWNILY